LASVTRHLLHRLLNAVAAVGIVVASLWPATGAAQTTTPTPTTTPATTVRPTTTRPVATTTRAVTSTTAHHAPDEGRFNVTPRSGAPGATIRITDVVPSCPVPAGATVLVAIGMGNGRGYGSHIFATASTNAEGGWGGTVNVPNIPSGAYEIYASCFIQLPGQYDDEILLPYGGPTFVVTGSPISSLTPTSIAAEPASKRSERSPWLVLGIVVAAVVGLAAVIYAMVMRSRVSHGRS
jgi:hypothetical protein